MGAKVIIFDKILNSTFLKGLRHSALNWSSQTTFRCPFRLGNECQGSGEKTGNCLIELNFLLFAEKQKKVFVLSKLHSCNISVIEKAQSDASF